MSNIKKDFLDRFKSFSEGLTEYVSDEVGDWKIKGFLDIENDKTKNDGNSIAIFDGFGRLEIISLLYMSAI